MTYYRLIADRAGLSAGTLVFSWRASAPTKEPGLISVTDRPDGYGSRLDISAIDLEREPQPHWTEFETLLSFYMSGRAVPPNITVGAGETLDRDLNALAHHGSLSHYSQTFGGRLLLPGSASRHGNLAFAIASKTQGGNLDGGAIALIYRAFGDLETPRTARFQLCAHEVIEGRGANHQRGWHPAHCGKCKLDMTVDSGD